MMRLKTCTNHIVPHASHHPLNDDGLKAKDYALAYESIFTTREIVTITVKKVNFAQVGNRRWHNDPYNEQANSFFDLVDTLFFPFFFFGLIGI